jgi:hypothetical protein
MLYTHPIGLLLTLPSSWTLDTPDADGVGFLPPNVKTGTEASWSIDAMIGGNNQIAALDASGLAMLAAGFAQMIPGARQLGGAKKINSGVVFHHEAELPNGKTAIHTFSKLVRSGLFLLLLSGKSTEVAAHIKEFDAMVASLKIVPPTRDPKLSGLWASETLTLELNPSGSGRRTEKKKTLIGSWYGGAGRLLLLSKDGTEAMSGLYMISSDRKTLTLTTQAGAILLTRRQK